MKLIPVVKDIFDGRLQSREFKIIPMTAEKLLNSKFDDFEVLKYFLEAETLTPIAVDRYLDLFIVGGDLIPDEENISIDFSSWKIDRIGDIDPKTDLPLNNYFYDYSIIHNLSDKARSDIGSGGVYRLHNDLVGFEQIINIKPIGRWSYRDNPDIFMAFDRKPYFYEKQYFCIRLTRIYIKILSNIM